jgi:diguanylate cyclase (GGDEF)-like protein
MSDKGDGQRLSGDTLPILPEAILAKLADAGRTEPFAEGQTIFRQSDVGDCMYVVEEGEVGLVFEYGMTPKRLGPGSFFGELALFSGRHLRAATAIATRDCVLRIVDRAAFDRLQATHPAALATLLQRTCIYLLEAEHSLLTELRCKARQLEQALDYLRRTKEELDSAELLAMTDGLTGIYNRRCLDHRIGALLEGARETEWRPVLILADIDRFKAINDNYGHDVGDLVLKHFAAALRRSVRQSDLPCRLGGDEFAVVLTDIGLDEGPNRATRILRSVGAIDVPLSGEELHVTASVGGTTHRLGESWESFFRRADQNLYRVKKTGLFRLGWDVEADAISS